MVQQAAPGATIQLAPGHYQGPITIARGITLRGAGELSRIVGPTRGGSVVRIITDEPVTLESLRLEDGHSDCGGAIDIDGGPVHLRNLYVRNCSAHKAGGAIHVRRGQVEAERLQISHTTAKLGGGVAVSGLSSRLVLNDSEIHDVQASNGGAAWISGSAQVKFEGMTIRGARANTADGGQALCACGNTGSQLELKRVRLGDLPIGHPISNCGRATTPIFVEGCDLPKWVLNTPGLLVRGDNQWR